jgi:hypothetical protein
MGMQLKQKRKNTEKTSQELFSKLYQNEVRGLMALL